MELIILSQLKFENISQFSLVILVGISQYCDTLFSFNNLISVSICLKLTSLKLKVLFLLHVFSHLRIAFKVASLTF